MTCSNRHVALKHGLLTCTVVVIQRRARERRRLRCHPLIFSRFDSDPWRLKINSMGHDTWSTWRLLLQFKTCRCKYLSLKNVRLQHYLMCLLLQMYPLQRQPYLRSCETAPARSTFKRQKYPVSAATNICSSSEGADFDAIAPFVPLRLQNLKQICSFNGEKQFDTAKVPPVYSAAKIRLSLQSVC